MDIAPDIRIADLCLMIDDTLVVGDVHIGYEEALNKQGVMVPRFQSDLMMERMSRILQKENPKRVVIIGDLKHEFGAISDQEWRDTLKFLDLLLSAAKEVILIRGNHDTILEPIAKKRGVRVVDELIIDDILFIHGDEEPDEIPPAVKTIIIGHAHPAVRLQEGAKSEIYKCFLVGDYKKRRLIVLPSFFLLTEGTDVLSERLLSPFLQKDIGAFRAIIVGDDGPLDFCRLRDLRAL